MKIKLPFRRMTDQRGFGHVELVLIIAFVAVFAFVGVRVITASHAATVPYLTQAQCELRGRGYDTTPATGTNPCTNNCHTGQGTIVIAPIYNYCSNAETASRIISQTLCASLGRVWLIDGCARLATQVTTKGPLPQCVNQTYTYYVTSTNDKCGPPTTTTPAPTGGPAPGSSQPTPVTITVPPVTTNPPTHTPTNVPADVYCTLRGRVISGNSCTNTCVTGSLVTSGTYDYCSGALTPVSSMDEATCVTTLHRKWLVDGCARLWAQTPNTVPNAQQCNISGQTYYVESTYDACNTSSTAAASAATTATKTVKGSSGTTTSGGTSNSGGSSILTPTYCEQILHRIWNGSCENIKSFSHPCMPGYGSYHVANPYDYCTNGNSSNGTPTDKCPTGATGIYFGSTFTCVYPPSHYKSEASCNAAGFSWAFSVLPIIHVHYNQHCTYKSVPPVPIAKPSCIHSSGYHAKYDSNSKTWYCTKVQNADSSGTHLDTGNWDYNISGQKVYN